MTMLTLDYLKSLKACRDACEWFESTFPAGAEIAYALAACRRDDWVCWLACKTSDQYRLWCAGKAFEFAAGRNPSLAPWANNVTADNWREARQAAAYAAYAADAYAAYAAADAARAAARAAAYAAYAADAYAAYAAAAAARAAAARKTAYKELRAEAERVLAEVFSAPGGAA